MSEWISVEDRLPECIDGVLIFSPEYHTNNVMRVRIVEGQFVRMCTDATHWMPLPEPPEEAE